MEQRTRRAFTAGSSGDHSSIQIVWHAVASVPHICTCTVQNIWHCESGLFWSGSGPGISWHFSQPSISKLLAATEELKSKESVSRRYTDVGPVSFKCELELLTHFWLQTVILICKPVWPMFDSVPPRLKSTFIWKATWNECPISGFSDYDFALINKGPNAKPAEDPRANIALARTNWLHSKYKIVRPKHLIFCFII